MSGQLEIPTELKFDTNGLLPVVVQDRASGDVLMLAYANAEALETVRLLSKGLDHTLKKLPEEATEVILAAKGESETRLAEEAADLLFHLLVALAQRGVGPAQVMDVLRARRAK